MLENRCIDFEIKFAHSAGHTVLIVNEQNNRLMTGGSDGDVRSWPIERSDEEAESYDVGSAIYSLSTSSNAYYVASDSIDVKQYDLDGSYKGIVVRSTLNVYSICLSHDYKLLASGGGDFIVKIVNLEDHAVKQITGHEAPILSLRFDQKRKYLASSSCDGSVAVWNIEDLDQINLVKKFNNNHKKSNDMANSTTQCSMVWSPPTGDLLAVPNDESINFYERDHWSMKFSLKYANFNGISICEFDRTGKFFAASNSTGVLIVWNLNFKEVPIAIYVNEANALITCFKFNPSNNEKLVASDKNGQLIYIDVKPDDKMKKLNKELVENSYAKIEESNDEFDNDDGFDDAAFMSDLDKIGVTLNGESSNKNKKTISNSDSQEEEEEDFIPPKEKFTLSKFSNKKKRLIESDDDEDSNHTTKSELSSKGDSQEDRNVERQSNDGNESDKDEQEMFDIGALKRKYEPMINGDSFNEDDKNKSKADNLDQEEHKIINIKVKPIMQPTFKAGSTPVNLEHRFMVWNSVGIVTCSGMETENAIDVEFHNSDVFRPIHLPNTYNYTMADLHTESLLLAAPAIDSSDQEDTTASILFCMNFSSWDSNKEWRYQLPSGESVETIALATSFALVATDQRKLRLFTLSGIQLHLFSISDPIICLAAQDNNVQIISHNGSGLPGEQSVSMSLLKLNERSVYPLTQLTHGAQIPVALSPKSVIDWAGFTDEGNACVVDSAGLVRLFNMNSNCWIPVADLKSKNKNDHYFVISVSEIQEQIRCISCKGARYPSTVPKPDVFKLPFEIPLCEITTTKAKLEEQMIRLNLKKSLLEHLSSSGFDVDFTSEENTKKQIEIMIKLFALAVNAECNSLAIEIAGLMPNQLAIDGAIRYATQKNRTILINKLNKLSREKFSNHNKWNEQNIEQRSKRSALVNMESNKMNRKRQVEDGESLRPKQIKLCANQNPFRVKND